MKCSKHIPGHNAIYHMFLRSVETKKKKKFAGERNSSSEVI